MAPAAILSAILSGILSIAAIPTHSSCESRNRSDSTIRASIESEDVALQNLPAPDLSAFEDVDLKGWDFLATALVERGLDPKIVVKYLSDSRMPERGDIPFGSNPKESKAMYADLLKPERIAKAQACFDEHRTTLMAIGEKHRIAPTALVGIMYVETACGKHLGKFPVFIRLARLAGLSAPDNVSWNYQRLRDLGESVTLKQLTERAEYLHNTFIDQLPALLSLSNRANVDPFSFTGSIAGAFGIPQFLPGSLVQYGTDGNGDHKVNIYEIPDAAASIAVYLKSHGWPDEPLIPAKGKLVKELKAKKEKALFAYNRSEPYAHAVLTIASKVK